MCAALACLAQAQTPDPQPTNSTWNYDLNGTDWDFASCNLAYYVQAPINITNQNFMSSGGYKYYFSSDWADWGFSLLPDFSSGNVTWAGVDQYVYTVMGDFGGIYAAEPTKSTSSHIVYWQSNSIRFHYPAEHTLNNTQYELEMQIFTTDLYNRHLLCYSNKAAFSIIF